jgi:hypothetical protein
MGYNILNKNRILYSFFWVIPRRLNIIFRRFGTLSVPSIPSEHVESLKSKRSLLFCAFYLRAFVYAHSRCFKNLAHFCVESSGDFLILYAT